MPYTMFVEVDPNEVRSGVWQLLFNDTFDLTELTNGENENSQAHGWGITGQHHLNAAVVSLILYRKLQGLRWTNVANVQTGSNAGADVEFLTKADAMVFKLTDS